MIVVVEDGGGLANRLFVFANAVACGLETSHRVMNPAFRGWSSQFEGTRGDHLGAFPRRHRALLGGRFAARVAASLSFRFLRLARRGMRAGPLLAMSLEWPQCCTLDTPSMRDAFRRHRLVLIKGWLFRDPAGVARHSEVLRQFFRPIEPLRTEADRVVAQCRQNGEVLVGVHVRHGDYQGFMGGRYFYPFDTYIALMRKVSQFVRPKIATFLVCSDEPQNSAQAADLTVTLSAMGPVQDLWALSRCDLMLGPPSTFSAWAAFLGSVPLWEIADPQQEPAPDGFRIPHPVPRPPDGAP